MAYTYDDFIAAATGANLLNKFSEADLAAAKTDPQYGQSLLKLQQDEMNASTAQQKLLAQETANQLRKTYGTTAASTPGATGTAGTAGSFSYSKEDEYQKLLNAVMNPQSFEYDHREDPQYSAYKKTYLREADRAREDTLAKVSAASGGTPSSYAVTAATQAGDYYTGQLNDVVPSLYQDAYQRYLNAEGLKQDALGAVENDRNFDYSVYLQQLEQEQQKIANALAIYQTLGYATPEVAQILGIGSSVTEDGGGGSGPGVGNGYQYDTHGLTTEEIKAVQSSLGVTPDGVWGPATESAYQAWVGSQNNGQESGNVTTGLGASGTAGMASTEFDQAKSVFTQLLNSNDTKNAELFYDTVNAKLSDAQRSALLNIAAAQGMLNNDWDK